VVIVTGAGRGLGRAHALELAHQGARLVVNDLGSAVDGTGSSAGPASEVVDEIRALGGEAVANTENVADWEGARRLVGSALEAFGRLDALVNNAGILRDRMLVNMTEDEWDAVIEVHLKGTFAPSRWAAAHWRTLAKRGERNDARIVNTSSSSGLAGNVGQTNYGAAKAGIAAFTIIAAQELGSYGVTVNAISPGARTRMTENLERWSGKALSDGFDERAPDNVAPLVAWLASPDSSAITGRVFGVRGGRLSLLEGWRHTAEVDRGAQWEADEVGPAVRELVSRSEVSTSKVAR
jgi:NAD(P)-dependent dehydrogenase (short-subunit alcohol dehydrogenase family)